ncbi:MAG: HTH domain-containing protein [Bacteroidetes bacterium]|nr:MAG: HTH domain-containing protein [Bacteroidota bacterium]
MHIMVDTVNLPLGTVNDTVNGTVNDTIFLLVTEQNTITATQISEHLKLSVRTVRRRINELKKSGKIERIGSDKKGHWRVTE